MITNENNDSILTYPKYLTSQDLFDLQLQDCSFRNTILIQFLIVLRSFLKPVTVTQKKLFFFTDSQVNYLLMKKKKQIKELLLRIRNQLTDFKVGGKSFYQRTQNIFRNEEIWENWKEGNCKPYELFPSKDLIKSIKEITDEIKSKSVKNDNIKYAINVETQNNFNLNNDLLRYLDNNFQDMSKTLTDDVNQL